MRNAGSNRQEQHGRLERDDAVPKPTPHFKRRAWHEFQRALDPLAPPRPIRPLRYH